MTMIDPPRAHRVQSRTGVVDFDLVEVFVDPVNIISLSTTSWPSSASKTPSSSYWTFLPRLLALDVVSLDRVCTDVRTLTFHPINSLTPTLTIVDFRSYGRSLP